MTKKTHYIVSVRCQQVKYYNGSIATKEGTEVWLSKADGYPTCTTVKSCATKFKNPPTKEEITAWDGMPWYYRLQPNSERVFKVVEEITYTVTEEEV